MDENVDDNKTTSDVLDENPISSQADSIVDDATNHITDESSNKGKEDDASQLKSENNQEKSFLSEIDNETENLDELENVEQNKINTNDNLDILIEEINDNNTEESHMKLDEITDEIDNDILHKNEDLKSRNSSGMSIENQKTIIDEDDYDEITLEKNEMVNEQESIIELNNKEITTNNEYEEIIIETNNLGINVNTINLVGDSKTDQDGLEDNDDAINSAIEPDKIENNENITEITIDSDVLENKEIEEEKTEFEQDTMEDQEIKDGKSIKSPRENLVNENELVAIITDEIVEKDNSLENNNDEKGVTVSFDDENIDQTTVTTSTGTQKQDHLSKFFTVYIQLDDGTIKNQIVAVSKSKNKKQFLGGYRHKLTGIEYHNASIQTRPRPRPPPTTELFSRNTQTLQIRHQKINTTNTTSSQMTMPELFVSNVSDNLIVPGKYETADEYEERLLENIIVIQKYYRRWLAKHIVDDKRKQRDERLEWEKHENESKLKEKEERIKKEYERRMHPKTRADFDLLYNGLEKWRQDRLVEISNSNKGEAEKKAEKLLLLDEETDLLAAIDRHKIDRNQQSKGEEVQKLLSKAAAPKSWKDTKGRKIQMDTPYTIRSRELLDILNSLNMQYLTQDERLDVLLTLKHTVKEHDCKLTRDIIDLVDREADFIMRNVKDNTLAGLRKRIVTLFLQYCKTPTFNPEISLLLRVPPDPSVLIGDINYCKYCGRYLRSTEFSLSTKSAKLTICKSCARKENQSRKRQDYSHYRRILKDLQMNEQQIEDNSKIAFIFKQNDIKTLMESVWDSKSILSECEDFDDLVFVRWNYREHWTPWNTILITKDEAESHRKVVNLSETYSVVMLNRINQKHVIAKNMFNSLEKMTEKLNYTLTKPTVKI